MSQMQIKILLSLLISKELIIILFIKMLGQQIIIWIIKVKVILKINIILIIIQLMQTQVSITIKIIIITQYMIVIIKGKKYY